MSRMYGDVSAIRITGLVFVSARALSINFVLFFVDFFMPDYVIHSLKR